MLKNILSVQRGSPLHDFKRIQASNMSCIRNCLVANNVVGGFTAPLVMGQRWLVCLVNLLFASKHSTWSGFETGRTNTPFYRSSKPMLKGSKTWLKSKNIYVSAPFNLKAHQTLSIAVPQVRETYTLWFKNARRTNPYSLTLLHRYRLFSDTHVSVYAGTMLRMRFWERMEHSSSSLNQHAE